MKKIFNFLIAGLLTFGAKAGTIDAPVVVEGYPPNGATIQLHEITGPCVNGARLATWISPNRQDKVQGCWKTEDGTILSISWFDGESSTIPMQAFLQSSKNKPRT